MKKYIILFVILSYLVGLLRIFFLESFTSAHPVDSILKCLCVLLSSERFGFRLRLGSGRTARTRVQTDVIKVGIHLSAIILKIEK